MTAHSLNPPLHLQVGRMEGRGEEGGYGVFKILNNEGLKKNSILMGG